MHSLEVIPPIKTLWWKTATQLPITQMLFDLIAHFTICTPLTHASRQESTASVSPQHSSHRAAAFRNSRTDETPRVLQQPYTTHL